MINELMMTNYESSYINSCFCVIKERRGELRRKKKDDVVRVYGKQWGVYGQIWRIGWYGGSEGETAGN